MKPLPAIEPIIGEPLCFWVQSRRKRSLRHRVELDALPWLGPWGTEFNGECRCEDFVFHRALRLRENQGQPRPGHQMWNGTTCYHIDVVREWYLQYCLRETVKVLGRAEKKTRNQKRFVDAAPKNAV